MLRPLLCCFLTAAPVVMSAPASEDPQPPPGAEFLDSSDISETREKELREALAQLDKAKKNLWPDSLARDFTSPAGRRKLRDFLSDHGFQPDHLAWLETLPSGADPVPLASMLALRSAQLLRRGPEEYGEVWTKWDRGQKPGTSAWPGGDTSPERLLAEPPADLDGLLSRLAPKNPVYRELQRHFVWMDRNIESLRKNFTEIPPIRDDAEIVKRGEEYRGAMILARRLAEEGCLDPPAGAQENSENELPVFTARLSEALQCFQEKQGLAVDGILGPNTLAALNRSPDERLEILRINLHRCRLLPDRPGKRHILVNVPSARLEAFSDGDTPTLEMKTIVGRTVRDLQTPLFRDVMEAVQFGPYWNVPLSIARDELVPEERANPGYLARNDFEVVPSYASGETRAINSWTLSQVTDGDLFLRQRPGPGNALGSVKFLFPNAFAIYLHDTPADSLFDRSQRDFSHGCVRVEKPAALAEYILGPQGWSRQRIEETLASGEHQRIGVEQPPNVYIVYLTAYPTWRNKPGDGVRFEPDIYGRDEALLQEGD